MNTFTYVITEGVLDVCFLAQLLRSAYGLKQISRKGDLPEAARRWIESFKWPVEDDIKRLSVPAPVILADSTGQSLVGLRNAEGLSKIRKQIDADHVSFDLLGWRPGAAAVVLDLDTEPPVSRFDAFASLLAEFGYPRPVTLDNVVEAGRQRAGVFGLPGNGLPGTLDDLLLVLGKVRFPTLSSHATQFIESWKLRPDATNPPHEELGKPAGYKKAEIAAMTALLKPLRPAAASIEDHRWVPERPDDQPVLMPLVNFFGKLLACPRNPRP